MKQLKRYVGSLLATLLVLAMLVPFAACGGKTNPGGKTDDDKKTVAAADLLVPGIGELIGGSQREEREDVLIAKMKEMNIDPADYKWYLDLRRYGGTVHSGFGLGFERMIMYLTGIANIRDVLPFPRTVSNLEY